MIEQSSRHLFSALEARAADALEKLHGFRTQIEQLEARLAEAEAAKQELEAARLELMEENRELDEQNRELEEDNARLRERLRKGEPAPVFPGPGRRAQGLAALMGQRPREDSKAVAEADAGDRAERGQPQPASETSQGAVPPATNSFAAHRKEEPAPVSPVAEPLPQSGTGQEQVDKQEREKAASAAQDERQGHLAIEQAPSADALLTQWYQRYPNTFFKGHTRPLKVGIHQDLAAREPWPEKLVRRALAGYVNLPRYLKAVRESAERIDLDGAPAGNVDAQAAEHAKRKLERLQSERRERGRTASGTPRRNGTNSGNGAEGQPRKAKPRSPTRSAKPAPASREAPAETPATPADPEARLEAKLSALLAKHNGQAKGH